MTKETATGDVEHFQYAVSSHQGWRRSQEDSHIAEVLTDDFFLLAVFDGHGGPEVAKFSAEKMPGELKSHELFQQGNYSESLIACFHRMDEQLLTEEGRNYIEKFRPQPEVDQAQDDALAVLKKYMGMKNEQNQAAAAKAAAAATAATSSEGGGAGGGAAAAVPTKEVEKDEAGNPVIDEDVIQAGCTAIVALVHKDVVYVANAGDSRAVLSRGKKAVALSEDHKPNSASERERIVNAGGFVSEIGGICRVNGNLSLSRAIGDLRYKQNPNLEPAAQIITAQPEVTKMELTEEDQFLLLACDGIWDVMDKYVVS